MDRHALKSLGKSRNTTMLNTLLQVKVCKVECWVNITYLWNEAEYKSNVTKIWKNCSMVPQIGTQLMDYCKSTIHFHHLLMYTLMYTAWLWQCIWDIFTGYEQAHNHIMIRICIQTQNRLELNLILVTLKLEVGCTYKRFSLKLIRIDQKLYSIHRNWALGCFVLSPQ